MKKNLFCILLLLLCPAIYGQYNDSNETGNRTERIINFHSDIVIDATGMMRVTESIKVYAAGRDIKRGIVRCIPVYRTDKYGVKKKMDINILSVICNGHSEKYRTENAGDNKEIFIGDAKVSLKSGVYEYVITYETPGQVGFFDTFDEIYWNVTGNEWEFIIERASASITLPNNAESISTSCYTGPEGSTATNCSSEDAGNKVHFETNRKLFAHEGFTVVVSFPRDIIPRLPDVIDEPIVHNEKIIHFHSDIIINASGKIRVTESIQVLVDGDYIKRQITRCIPVHRTDRYGMGKEMEVNIISVLCNGENVKYKTERLGNNKYLDIGDPDVDLEPGIYEFTITYENLGSIEFSDTFDELSWDVTGTHWRFPIEHASASITLPNDAHSINTSCYAGYRSSKDTTCLSEEKGNKIYFETIIQMTSYEGFNVKVSFPRDIVKRPPWLWLTSFWGKNRYAVTFLLCLSIFGVFFYFTWKKVGQDPKKPVVIPTFNPPHGWSPTATRYLFKRKYDNKTFTVALVEMAVKKAIRISNMKEKYTLEAIERKENLSAEELEIYDTLFTDNTSISVTDTNHAKFSKTNTKLTKSLKESWNFNDYFRHNTKYVGWATALIAVLLILYSIITEESDLVMKLLLIAPFVGLAAMSMIAKKLGKGCIASSFKVTGFFVLGICALFTTIAAIAMLAESWDTSWKPLLVILLIAYVIYIYLIKAPTQLGAQTVSELKGFKMYLKTAEEDRLKFLTPPEKTPELFEKLLPYAIALDVENEWGKKFTEVLKQLNYEPDWYKGDKSFTASNFSSTFARSFTSSVDSARINPSSSSSGGSWSSGGGGGGHSGGGGGGGGGRGW